MASRQDSGPNQPRILSRDHLQDLIDVLVSQQRTVYGPRLRDGAIMIDEVCSADDLPIGWRERQTPGRYRVERRTDAAVFGHTLGPDSWKRWLHPPQRLLFRAKKGEPGFQLQPAPAPTQKAAFLGVRACDLAAIQRLDRVFLEGPYVNSDYQARRKNAFIVAVNCGQAAQTCFCASMDTGPEVSAGYDLCLTELMGAEGHRFLLEAGSDAGAEVMQQLPTRTATPADIKAKTRVLQQAGEQISRNLDQTAARDSLEARPDHPRWAHVAERCFACGNCTQVCPTCFCTSVEDHSDLMGQTADRVEVWDSCFTSQFAELGGGQVRETTKARYRQWLTHKLSSWHTQFGQSGCVGCGRCITWCPVGIDLVEEATTISLPELVE